MKLRFLNPLLVAGVFALWLVFLRPTFLGGPIDYVIVSGDSMRPSYKSGDFVITKRGEYKQGDVVAFRASGGTVIHRIVGGDAQSGFVTQGDNRNVADQWRPRSGDVLGAAWIHVPGAGTWLAHLRQPIVFAPLVGLAGFAVVVPALKRKRRQRRGTMTLQTDQPTGSAPSISPLWAVTGFAVMLTAVCAALAVYSYTQPETKSTVVQRSRFTQTTAFDYTILTQPSTLYPEGRIGPVSSDDAAQPSLPPIYSRLVQALDVGFNYRIEGSTADVAGDYTAEVVVSAGEDEWTRSQQLTAATRFEGPAFDGRLRIDLAPIRAMIETIEKETGVAANFYSINLLLHVQTSGSIDGESFAAVQEPLLSFRLSRSRLTPAETLVVSKGEERADTVTSAREIGAAGVSIPLGRARVAAVGGMALGLALASALVVAIYTGIGQSEAARVRLRYGVVILPVSHVDERGSRKVQVESLDNLGRLAQRNGSVIFAQKQPRATRYFISDGATTVEYTQPAFAGARRTTVEVVPPPAGISDHPTAS